MKYKLTNTTKQVCGRTLHQIEAVSDFGSVRKGDLGGWIEKEYNLIQEGNCWVSGDARVSGDIKIKSGLFFGMRYNNEEIILHPMSDNHELICKGNVEFGSDEGIDLTDEDLVLELERRGLLRDGKVLR